MREAQMAIYANELRMKVPGEKDEREEEREKKKRDARQQKDKWTKKNKDDIIYIFKK